MKLSFHAYCGMTYEVDCDGDLESIRKTASRFLRRRRKNGQPVVKLSEYRWECQEPENCSMIPDTAGVLVLDPSEPEVEEEEYEEEECF